MSEPQICDVCKKEIQHHEDGAIVLFGWWKDRGDEWEHDPTDDEIHCCASCSHLLSTAIVAMKENLNG